jgi:hypothetical protein
MKSNILSKEKYKNVCFEKKKTTRNCNRATSSIHGDKKFKERPDPKYNKERIDCRAKPHPAKLSIYEKELKKILGLGTVEQPISPSTYSGGKL